MPTISCNQLFESGKSRVKNNSTPYTKWKEVKEEYNMHIEMWTDFA
jgi:hypothetical protein